MYPRQNFLQALERCQSGTHVPEWQQALPAEWRAAASVPLDITTWREYEMPASRSMEYDEEGKPCYYRHAYVLDMLRSDDDDEFYEAPVYGEELCAWRLQDQRWLIWRVEYREGCRNCGVSYSLSDCMPR